MCFGRGRRRAAEAGEGQHQSCGYQHILSLVSANRLRPNRKKVTMATGSSADELLQRIHADVQHTFYPFWIVKLVAELGSATSDELLDRVLIDSLGAYALDPKAHAQQMARLEKTFGLISASTHRESHRALKNAQPIHYTLTAKGKKLLSASQTQVIAPLENLLAPRP